MTYQTSYRTFWISHLTFRAPDLTFRAPDRTFRAPDRTFRAPDRTFRAPDRTSRARPIGPSALLIAPCPHLTKSTTLQKRLLPFITPSCLVSKVPFSPTDNRSDVILRVIEGKKLKKNPKTIDLTYFDIVFLIKVSHHGASAQWGIWEYFLLLYLSNIY